MRHKGWIIGTIVLLFFVVGAFLMGVAGYYAIVGSNSKPNLSLSEGEVGVVSVEGTILDSRSVVEEIEDYRKDKDIKAVILRIESPGGSVAASQEIFDAVAKLNLEKPVVASMGSVAASGGYYVACAARKILANPGTITGSIGVRMDHLMLADLLALARIKHETLKSGQYKDMAPFDRPMEDGEREILQGMLADIHDQFKGTVTTSRNIPRERVDEIADGRVYTGRQALALALVDQLGGFSDAVKLVADMAGIKGDPELSYPSRSKGIFEDLFSGAKSAIAAEAARAISDWQPMFMMGSSVAPR